MISTRSGSGLTRWPMRRCWSTRSRTRVFSSLSSRRSGICRTPTSASGSNARSPTDAGDQVAHLGLGHRLDALRPGAPARRDGDARSVVGVEHQLVVAAPARVPQRHPGAVEPPVGGVEAGPLEGGRRVGEDGPAGRERAEDVAGIARGREHQLAPLHASSLGRSPWRGYGLKVNTPRRRSSRGQLRAPSRCVLSRAGARPLCPAHPG